jgi:RibD C-terminal domain
MLADGLVDELHLFVYPLTRGPGPRLFPEEATPSRLSLAACEAHENGVSTSATDPRREASLASAARPSHACSLGFSAGSGCWPGAVSLTRITTLPVFWPVST